MGVPRILKKILPKSWVYRYELNSLHSQINSPMSIEEWKLKGSPLPPPNAVKWKMMLDCAKRYKCAIFVETGTFMGDTSYAMVDSFQKLHTIEFDGILFQKASRRFEVYPKVKVWNGDGGKILPQVMDTIQDEICLFWLDGHYSGSITGKAETNTSVLKELEAIYKHRSDHCVLIDDARLFKGKDDYPTLEEVEAFVRKFNPELNFRVENDIICICPF